MSQNRFSIFIKPIDFPFITFQNRIIQWNKGKRQFGLIKNSWRNYGSSVEPTIQAHLSVCQTSKGVYGCEVFNGDKKFVLNLTEPENQLI